MSQHEIPEGREPVYTWKIEGPQPRDKQLPLFKHAGSGFVPSPLKVRMPVSEEQRQENMRRSREARRDIYGLRLGISEIKNNHGQRTTDNGQKTRSNRRALLARVHIAKKELGLREEEYRDILGRWMVSSAGTMTEDQLVELDRYLQRQGWQPKPARNADSGVQNNYNIYYEKWAQQLGHRAGMGSPGQLAMIEALWDQLAWYWNKNGGGDRKAALRGFLLGRFKAEHLAFLKFEAAGQVIEAMKAILSRG